MTCPSAFGGKRPVANIAFQSNNYGLIKGGRKRNSSVNMQPQTICYGERGSPAGSPLSIKCFAESAFTLLNVVLVNSLTGNILFLMFPFLHQSVLNIYIL